MNDDDNIDTFAFPAEKSANSTNEGAGPYRDSNANHSNDKRSGLKIEAPSPDLV